VHKSSSIVPLVFIALVTFGPILAPSAGAQQKCSDEEIVGRATSKDRSEAVKNADSAWGREASAKLGARIVFHLNPRAMCTSGGSTTDYACTVSAKACTDPPEARRASSCWPHGFCEICCENSDGSMNCYPQCK